MTASNPVHGINSTRISVSLLFVRHVDFICLLPLLCLRTIHRNVDLMNHNLSRITFILNHGHAIHELPLILQLLNQSLNTEGFNVVNVPLSYKWISWHPWFLNISFHPSRNGKQDKILLYLSSVETLIRKFSQQKRLRRYRLIVMMF